MPLEATLKNADMTQARAHLLEAPAVPDVHDLHAWTITGGLNEHSTFQLEEVAHP